MRGYSPIFTGLQMDESAKDAEQRAGGDQYGETQTGSGILIIAVEKDFACLDRDDAENADAFPDPKGEC